LKFPFPEPIRRAMAAWFLLLPVALPARPEPAEGFAAIVRRLTEYRSHFLEYSRLGALEERLARHRLEHSRNLKASPRIEVGTDGGISAGAAWEFSGPRWKAQGEISGPRAEELWAGLAIPLARSSEGKRKVLDTLIALIETHSRLEFQRLLLGDLREILYRRIRLKELDGQAGLLSQGALHIGSLIGKLQGLVKGGKLAANALEPLRISQFRFGLRVRALGLESGLLIRQVEEDYGIGEAELRNLDVDWLAGEIRALDAGKKARPSHIFQQIDSVAVKARLARARLQSAKELDLWLGVSAGRHSAHEDPRGRLSLELNYRFDDQPFLAREREDRVSPSRAAPAPPPTDRRDSQALRDSISRFRAALERVERRVFQEIGLGSWESVFNLNAFIEEYFEQGLQLSRLESEALVSEVSLVRTLDDLPKVPADADWERGK
jgi:hypothetical protein